MSANVLVLGAGAVGASAARYAADLDAVTSLTLADRNEAAARGAVTGLERTAATAVDVTDAEALRRLLAPADIVLNCVGPYYRFARPVFETALETGTDYLDVNDDWEPTLDLLGDDERAAAAGVRAVLGVGASPGLSNLLAVMAMRRLPSATRLVTAWREDDPSEGYSAAKEHWLQQCSGTIRIWQNGAYADVPPLDAVTVEYPGRGPLTLTTVGHPEPVTLPRAFPALRESVNAMACPNGVIATLRRIRDEIDAGRQTPRTAAEAFERYRRNDEDMNSLGLPGLFASASDDEGNTVTVVLNRYPDGMGPVTAAPMVAGLSLLLGGGGRPGVTTPEGAFEPEAFLSAFARVAGLEEPVHEVHA